MAEDESARDVVATLWIEGRELLIRPLRPEDEKLYPATLARTSPDDLRLRFFSPTRISQRQISALTHYDRANALAFAAIGVEDGHLYGVARLHRTEADEAEFAVLVRTDMKGKNLGRALLEIVLARAPALGVASVFGLVLPENTGMLALGRELGFLATRDPSDPGLVRLEVDVPPAGEARQAA